MGEKTPAFLGVMSNMALPCAVLCLFPEAEEGGDSDGDGYGERSSSLTVGSSFDVDALRQARKGFQILWDGARCAEEIICAANEGATIAIASPSRIGILDLRGEAVIFLLRTVGGAF